MRDLSSVNLTNEQTGKLRSVLADDDFHSESKFSTTKKNVKRRKESFLPIKNFQSDIFSIVLPKLLWK